MADKNSNSRIWSLNLITSPLCDVIFHKENLMEKPEFGLEGFCWVKEKVYFPDDDIAYRKFQKWE